MWTLFKQKFLIWLNCAIKKSRLVCYILQEDTLNDNVMRNYMLINFGIKGDYTKATKQECYIKLKEKG